MGASRLLVYFPDLTLFDGAAEAETGGFFDIWNVPPWDTWIGLFPNDPTDRDLAVYLVSWVPPAFLELVDRGVQVNPEECILWLEDSDVPLAKMFRR